MPTPMKKVRENNQTLNFHSFVWRRHVLVLFELELQKKLEVSTVIKVNGIPKVTPKGFDKLRIYIIKIFKRFGKILRDYYPTSENGHTEKWVLTLNFPLWIWMYILKTHLFSFISYLFIEYENHKSALEAIKWTNNSELDSEYTFLIQLVPDFKRWVEFIMCFFSCIISLIIYFIFKLSSFLVCWKG